MRRLLRRRRPNERLRRALTVVGTVALVMVLVSAGSQLFVGRSLGLVPTTGQAMAPAIRGGGMVLCLPYGWAEPKVGDIVIFRPATMDHDLCRRIVGAGPDGWITRGDGLAATDQQDGVSPVTRADIHGYVPQFGGRAVWLPGFGVLGARPGSRGRLVVALAAALVLVAVPPARAAGGRLSPRRRRAMAASRTWVYAGAALICTLLTAGATVWVGGQASICLESEQAALSNSTATGPVDITISPASRQVVVRNESPVALVVMAYPEPRGQAMVDRRFALVPAHGSQAFGLQGGTMEAGSGLRLAYAPAVVPGDWLYPMAREWGALWGFVALAAIQFALAAAVLCGADLAIANIRV